MEQRPVVDGQHEHEHLVVQEPQLDSVNVAPAPIPMPVPMTAPTALASGAPRPGVDRFPQTPADWRAFAGLPAPDRCAVYLRSIRSMLVFFVVLTVIGIILMVVFFLIGINAAEQSTATTNVFGQ